MVALSTRGDTVRVSAYGSRFLSRAGQGKSLPDAKCLGDLAPRISNPQRLAWCVALLAIVGSIVFVLSLSGQFNFVADEWEPLVRRPGWALDDFLRPYHEHAIVVPIFIYKVLQAVFGMTSYLPYHLTALAISAVAAILLFAFLQQRVGGMLALCGLLPVLFLGAAAEDLLWAFQMVFFGSVAAGIGVLMCLAREDRRGDLGACGLLVVSLAFSSVGVAFLVAVVADFIVARRPRRERLFVVAVPLAIYIAWYLGWGHQDAHHVSAHNLLNLPSFILHAAGAAVASLLGQEAAMVARPGRDGVLYEVIALILLVAVAFRIWRDRRCPRGLAVALTLLFSLWVLVGLDLDRGRLAVAQRYQYAAVVFLLIVAAEALVGIRPRPSVRLVAVAVAIFATVSGARLLEHERALWDAMGVTTGAILGGVEVAGPAADPSHVIRGEQIRATVALYRDAVERFGSPASKEAELLVPGPYAGHAADSSVIQAERIHLGPALPGRSGCRFRPAPPGRRTTTVLGPGRWTVTSRGGESPYLLLARFSTEGISLGLLDGDKARSLILPVDRSRRPWRLISGMGSITICRAGGA
jgi:hypothetical protein